MFFFGLASRAIMLTAFIWRQRWYYLDTKRNPCGLIELFPHYVVVHKEAAAYVKIAAAG